MYKPSSRMVSFSFSTIDYKSLTYGGRFRAYNRFPYRNMIISTDIQTCYLAKKVKNPKVKILLAKYIIHGEFLYQV